MNIEIPELSLVVLIGVSGSGKSSFARRHFLPTEVISSDYCRGLISDDENNQAITSEAFELLRTIAGKRLQLGKLTAIDATSLRPEDRRPYIELARAYHCLPVAIVLNLPERVCQDRNVDRPDRDFGPHVIRHQRSLLRRNLRNLRREGFRHVWTLESEEAVNAATITRLPLWNNRRDERGPFDIIGDIHGCYEELVELLGELGYAPAADGAGWSHPQGRRLVFLGDLVDRGPNSPGVVQLAAHCVNAGTALCVPGNHDIKFMRAVFGKQVRQSHGLAETLIQYEAIERQQPGATRAAAEFIDKLVSHYVLDDGKLVVAHAGLKEEMHGRGSGKVREFCLYGETTGETDEFGLPVRHNWAAEYRGRAMVVYGHTPVPEPEWLNGTICIDTGCAFGGKLTALRYPERQLASVEAKAVFAEPAKPFPVEAEKPNLTAQQQHDDLPHLEDVVGKRIIDTRLQPSVTIREENAAAALEVMSRFAVDAKWLIYLPPTMSPCETSMSEDLLEHPAEAFEYFRHRGVDQVVCEEKHMGSRAVLVVCRDVDAARTRFGVTSGATGGCYTRTGRPFFDDAALEVAFLERVRAAATDARLWENLSTDWLCLDCELMPWSAKAQSLLRDQYASVGSAAEAGVGAALVELRTAASRVGGEALSPLLDRYEARQAAVERYRAAYRQYCWPVESLDDLKLAPFHVMASEGAVHIDKDHVWHMATLAEMAQHSSILLSTRHRVVNLTDAANCADAIEWWSAMTAAGGEGMVVKPRTFIARGRRGMVQPAVKCRGPEYLRIIYGPEYLAPEHLVRLRKRGLKHKRSLALREFALGVEALERFVRREPLRRVHECAFGVLALESEPVDPRL